MKDKHTSIGQTPGAPAKAPLPPKTNGYMGSDEYGHLMALIIEAANRNDASDMPKAKLKQVLTAIAHGEGYEHQMTKGLATSLQQLVRELISTEKEPDETGAAHPIGLLQRSLAGWRRDVRLLQHPETIAAHEMLMEPDMLKEQGDRIVSVYGISAYHMMTVLQKHNRLNGLGEVLPKSIDLGNLYESATKWIRHRMDRNRQYMEGVLQDIEQGDIQMMELGEIMPAHEYYELITRLASHEYVVNRVSDQHFTISLAPFFQNESERAQLKSLAGDIKLLTSSHNAEIKENGDQTGLDIYVGDEPGNDHSLQSALVQVVRAREHGAYQYPTLDIALRRAISAAENLLAKMPEATERGTPIHACHMAAKSVLNQLVVAREYYDELCQAENATDATDRMDWMGGTLLNLVTQMEGTQVRYWNADIQAMRGGLLHLTSRLKEAYNAANDVLQADSSMGRKKFKTMYEIVDSFAGDLSVVLSAPADDLRHPDRLAGVARGSSLKPIARELFNSLRTASAMLQGVVTQTDEENSFARNIVLSRVMPRLHDAAKNTKKALEAVEVRTLASPDRALYEMLDEMVNGEQHLLSGLRVGDERKRPVKDRTDLEGRRRRRDDGEDRVR